MRVDPETSVGQPGGGAIGLAIFVETDDRTGSLVDEATIDGRGRDC
jgi:hypothetical protein